MGGMLRISQPLILGEGGKKIKVSVLFRTVEALDGQKQEECFLRYLFYRMVFNISTHLYTCPVIIFFCLMLLVLI